MSGAAEMVGTMPNPAPSAAAGGLYKPVLPAGGGLYGHTAQPVPSASALSTGSLSTTLMRLGETALALSTEGSWPSASARSIVPAPSAAPLASTTAGASIETEPVALAAAAGPPNASTCSSVELPPRPSTARSRPPTTIDR